jgi:hypothetical protein
MKECDKSKIPISSNFILSISLLIMFDTLLLSPSLHCNTPLHFTTLHPTTLHYASLHFTTLHPTTLHYASLHFTTLHPTTLHYTYRHFISFMEPNACSKFIKRIYSPFCLSNIWLMLLLITITLCIAAFFFLDIFCF